jgi:hypothetical protein
MLTMTFTLPTARTTRRLIPITMLMIGIILSLGISQASAAEPTIGLGVAAPFAVVAGSTITNTGPSVISGDVGLSPGTAVTGFPPGTVTHGTIHAADTVADHAQAATTTAYNDAAGRAKTATISADLGGQQLGAGVYFGTTLALTGTLTLNAHGDAGAVFIFQSSSTLLAATGSVVSLLNGASACNVFWKVGSSATIGTTSTFVGTVLALTSITAKTGATVQGRLLARNGAVTLDSNTITAPNCPAVTPPASSPPASSSTHPGGGRSSTAPGSGRGTGTGTGHGGARGRPRASSAPSSTAHHGSATATSPAGGSTRTPSTPLAQTGTNISSLLLAAVLPLGVGSILAFAGRRRIIAKHRH